MNGRTAKLFRKVAKMQTELNESEEPLRVLKSMKREYNNLNWKSRAISKAFFRELLKEHDKATLARD